MFHSSFPSYSKNLQNDHEDKFTDAKRFQIQIQIGGRQPIGWNQSRLLLNNFLRPPAGKIENLQLELKEQAV